MSTNDKDQEQGQVEETSSATGIIVKEEVKGAEEDVQAKDEELQGREVDASVQEEGDEKTRLEDVPKITVKRGAETLMECEITKEELTIGRRQGNDILLDDRKVSREHARIRREGSTFRIEDLKSTGGLEVNGTKVTSQEIFTGDVITIGDFQLHFFSGVPGEEKTVFEGESDGERTTFDDDRTKFYEEPQAKLVVKRADNLSGVIDLAEEVVIGRGEDADVRLEDGRASRRHSKIALTNGSFVITDLQSANGTFVNGERITESALQNGDKVQIGNALFEFQMETGGSVAPGSGILKRVMKFFGFLAAIALIAWIIILLSNSVNAPHNVIISTLWEKQTKGPIHVCAAIGDLNNDVFNDIVVADDLGYIYALDGRTGGSIWNKPFFTGGAIFSSPSLGDVNQKDGTLDVIVGSEKGHLYTVDGGRGTLIWTSTVIKGAVTSSPALADLNADGVPDVVVGSKDNYVYALDGKQGGEIWNFDAKGEVTATPALADVDGDGVLDVIIGSVGNLYALSGANGKRLWVYQGEGAPSSAAAGRLNDDLIEDIAVCFHKELVVLNGKTGAALWTWTIPFITSKDSLKSIAPAMADINEDGVLDVVCSSGKGHVYVVDGMSKGNRYLWDFNTEGEVPSTAAIADFNEDGTLDVAVTVRAGTIYVINGKDGHMLAHFDVHEKTVSPVAIADVNDNSMVDLVLGTEKGMIRVVETNTRCKKNEVLWNSLGRGQLHTARVD
ncbi:MAG: FHA domain-containing protein [bacterium]